MLKHDLVPTWNIGLLSLIILDETMGIEKSRELMMRLSNHAGEGLEITNIQSATCSLDENLVKKRFDDLTLRLLNIVPCKTREPCCNHIPCCDGFFGIKVCRRCSERIDTERQSFATKRRPYPHFAVLKQLTLSINITIPLEKFGFINTKSKTSKIPLWIDDERWNSSKSCFLNQSLCHNGLT